MTDSHDPLQPDPLDELASSHLDGLTTDAEAARIAADPSLAERVARMADVRAAVRSDGPSVDEARKESSIAAALAAFDDAASDDTSADEGATLTPITAVRARPRASRRTLRLVGAAAAAVALALAVPLIGQLDSDPSGDDLAAKVSEETAADGQQRAETSDEASAGAASDALAPETYALPAGAPADLGSFADLASLEEAVRAQAPMRVAADAASPTTTSGAGAESVGACPQTPEATPPGVGDRVLTGTATLDDRAVIVFVYERTTGERTLVLLDAGDCAVILTRSL